MLSTPVLGLHVRAGRPILATAGGTVAVDYLLVCAGLQADRFASQVGAPDDMRIVPFRGEYFAFRPLAAELVRGLVYPVPDPRYPFLGVHVTRGVDDRVRAGPNAILALSLEGYRRRDVELREMWNVLQWRGFRRLARAHWRSGMSEMAGSMSRRVYASRVRNYLPDVGPADLVPAGAGVRAQAVAADGRLVDDFVVARSGNAVVVRNAPSPAATSSMALASLMVDRLFEGSGFD